jgi:hypothetical protein
MGAIQNLLNWRKLNQGHAAGEGKIWDPEHFADLVQAKSMVTCSKFGALSRSSIVFMPAQQRLVWDSRFFSLCG